MSNIIYAFFASRRYWTDQTALENAYEDLTKRLSCPNDSSVLITDEKAEIPSGKCLVAVIMSGAVQSGVIKACKKFSQVILYGAYIRGNSSADIANDMLRCNAAPALMDCWGVLRRTHSSAKLILDQSELENHTRLMRAYCNIQNAKILQIGVTEPWVISNSKDLNSYESRFGLTIQHVEQSELASLYESCAEQDAKPYMDHFAKSAKEICEPTNDDLVNAARMTCALLRLLEKHKAHGAAIACFNLLGLGTTSCLGVSYINECTDMVAACECDMDSAVTMLLLKQLTKTRLFMANPGLQPDKTVNFSHCTAPVCIHEDNRRPFVLRNHHESGIGVALQVQMPIGETVTACRISDEASSITIHRGVSVEGEYEPVCRTQVYVRFDDFDHYIDTALGCHQVLAFDDIIDDVKKLAAMFGLKLL